MKKFNSKGYSIYCNNLSTLYKFVDQVNNSINLFELWKIQ